MNRKKSTGWLMITGALSIILSYSLLIVKFEYPDILRQHPGTILTKFHNGNGLLIFIWWWFGVSALPLLVAFIKIGEWPETASIKWVTTFGVIAGITQIIGLLRWVFVIPVLATSYVNAADNVTKEIVVINFKTIHQLGGVLIGEHIGQLFTIVWSVMISIAFLKREIVARWISWLGLCASSIYLLAQLEIFKTVIPEFPVFKAAGFVGSTLWLIWLLCMGIAFSIRKS